MYTEADTAQFEVLSWYLPGVAEENQNVSFRIAVLRAEKYSLLLCEPKNWPTLKVMVTFNPSQKSHII
jgi:hypothetical protein